MMIAILAFVIQSLSVHSDPSVKFVTFLIFFITCLQDQLHANYSVSLLPSYTPSNVSTSVCAAFPTLSEFIQF